MNPELQKQWDAMHGGVHEKPRAWTAEEAREKFLAQVRGIARYWAELPGKDPQERCDGLAFSILNIIDGSTMGFPSIDLSLSPHPDDKEFNRGEGHNWFKPGMIIIDCHLHEVYYKKT